MFAFVAAERPRQSAQMLVDHFTAMAWTPQISDSTNTGDLSAVEALFASLDLAERRSHRRRRLRPFALYESLFGGASLDLMRQRSLPVLMSH